MYIGKMADWKYPNKDGIYVKSLSVYYFIDVSQSSSFHKTTEKF